MRRVYDNPRRERYLCNWPSGHTLVPEGFARILRVQYRNIRRAGLGPIMARSAVVGLMMVGMSSTWHPSDPKVAD